MQLQYWVKSSYFFNVTFVKCHNFKFSKPNLKNWSKYRWCKINSLLFEWDIESFKITRYKKDFGILLKGGLKPVKTPWSKKNVVEDRISIREWNYRGNEIKTGIFQATRQFVAAFICEKQISWTAIIVDHRTDDKPNLINSFSLIQLHGLYTYRDNYHKVGNKKFCHRQDSSLFLCPNTFLERVS